MISPLLNVHDMDTVALDFGVFIAEQARTYRCSREAIIAAVLEIIPLTPPSQPEVPTHSPAAQTDGEERQSSSLPSSPSVEPDQPETANNGEGAAAPATGESPVIPSGGDTGAQPAGGENVDAPEVLKTENGMDAANAGGQRADALGSAVGTGAPSLRDRIVAAHRAHPDWPPKLLAEHCGTREAQIRNAAQNRNLKLPTWWEYQRAQQAKTTEALKASPAKPQEAVEPAPAPEARPEPAQPPATISVALSAPLPPPAIKVMHRAPTGRFYLRERMAEITDEPRYVHQSLQPCPTGPGPLMTTDRKWAWYDTMERFKGAVKVWPELADMRKEAAHAR